MIKFWVKIEKKICIPGWILYIFIAFKNCYSVILGNQVAYHVYHVLKMYSQTTVVFV